MNFVDKLTLTSTTLTAMLENENINLKQFDTLIMDTQGTELMVLKGAESILSQFKFIKTEAADFHAYKDGCLLADLDNYLGLHGFKQDAKELFAIRDKGGSYYDVLYKKTVS